MKKIKSSVFIKIGLIMLLLVTGIEIVVLALSYNIIYENNLKNAENQIRNVADAAVQVCEAENLDDSSETINLGESLSSLCKTFNTTYLYAVKPDLDTKDETYVAIGFGEDAAQEARKTRYSGVLVKGTLSDEEIEVYNGDTPDVILHEKNQFGDTLVCYVPCTRYYDLNTFTYQNYKKPYIVGAEISLTAINKTFQDQFNKIAWLTIALILLMLLIFGFVLYMKVTKPIKQISSRMTGFITDREKGIEKLPVKGKDELALMASSFNTMTDEIDRYIGDIDALTREKHTQEAELNIARNIQMGLLRPERTDKDTAEIRAYMLPAKDVGGDLYDYCLLDDGRIFVAIADVSGKGISAALFMSRAITLLHQFALMGQSPAKTLEKYNNTLASQNPGGLFITTFLAVWDPATGELTYSNAGHNFPYILSDTLTALENAHGVAAGLFEGETYEDAHITLKAGDVLFLYTDGVNEAKNAKGEFYTTERLEEKLNACIGSGSQDTLQGILSDLNSFTHEAVQNDDVTMLTLRIKQQPGETVLRLSSEVTQLTVIRDEIRKLPVSDEMKKTLYLAAEEIFVNICSYAYDTPGEVEVKFAAGDRVEMSFTDSGKPFDPTADVPDMDEYDHENRIGGLGRFLTFTIADEYHYAYRDGKNVLNLYFQRGD